MMGLRQQPMSFRGRTQKDRGDRGKRAIQTVHGGSGSKEVGWNGRA
jgi:hypothetical protein